MEPNRFRGFRHCGKLLLELWPSSSHPLSRDRHLPQGVISSTGLSPLTTVKLPDRMISSPRRSS